MTAESLDQVMVGGGIPVAVHVKVISSSLTTLTTVAVLVVIVGISAEETKTFISTGYNIMMKTVCCGLIPEGTGFLYC